MSRPIRMHIGRSFIGTALEDDCPCGKAPCGLVDTELVSPDCPQHSMAAKTLCQGWPADTCPMCLAVADTNEEQR